MYLIDYGLACRAGNVPTRAEARASITSATSNTGISTGAGTGAGESSSGVEQAVTIPSVMSPAVEAVAGVPSSEPAMPSEKQSATVASDSSTAGKMAAECVSGSATAKAQVHSNALRRPQFDIEGAPMSSSLKSESSVTGTPITHQRHADALSAMIAGEGRETSGVTGGANTDATAAQGSQTAEAGEEGTGGWSNGTDGRKSTEITASSKPTGGSTGLVGSVRYLSVSAHEGARQTPHCDLESLGYVLLYLVRVSAAIIPTLTRGGCRCSRLPGMPGVFPRLVAAVAFIYLILLLIRATSLVVQCALNECEWYSGLGHPAARGHRRRTIIGSFQEIIGCGLDQRYMIRWDSLL